MRSSSRTRNLFFEHPIDPRGNHRPMAKMRCIECGCKLNKKHTALSCAILVAAHKLVGSAFQSGTLQGAYDGTTPVHDNPRETEVSTGGAPIDAGPGITSGPISTGSPLNPRPTLPAPNLNPSALQEGPTMVVRVRVPRWRINHG